MNDGILEATGIKDGLAGEFNMEGQLDASGRRRSGKGKRLAAAVLTGGATERIRKRKAKQQRRQEAKKKEEEAKATQAATPSGGGGGGGAAADQGDQGGEVQGGEQDAQQQDENMQDDMQDAQALIEQSSADGMWSADGVKDKWYKNPYMIGGGVILLAGIVMGIFHAAHKTKK